MNGGKRILWSDGDVLCGHHLDIFRSDIQQYSWTLHSSTSVNNYGIINLCIEHNILIPQQKLYIQKVECILPDGTYINYNGEYELSFSFKNFDWQKNNKLLYLGLQGDNFKSYERYNQFDTTNTITKITPKVFITDQYSKNNIPFAKLEKVSIDNIKIIYYGSFLCVQNERFYDKIHTIYNNLLSKQSFLKNELEKPNLLFEQKQNLSKRFACNNFILMNLELCKNSKSTYDIYQRLLNILCSLLSANNNIFTLDHIYDYKKDSLMVIETMLDNIISINNHKTAFTKVYGKLQNNKLIFALPNDIKKNAKIILWVQQPHSDHIKQWLLNTNISSISLYDQVHRNRIIGINRILQQYTNCYAALLDIHCDYFIYTEDLIINCHENMKNYQSDIYITIQ